MPNTYRAELSRYRLAKAQEMLADAKLLLQEKRYASSNNRSYYAIFNALRAVLALDGVEFKRHSGNIQYFLREYVKTGIFETKISEMVLSASSVRNDSDYDDFYEAGPEDAQVQVENAQEVLESITDYLETQRLPAFEGKQVDEQ